MTSAINPNNINGSYPVAGQDNNSQGFRDNFTNTKTNFQYAAAEITALQNNVILTGNISGVTLTNNMNYQPLVNAQIAGFSEKVNAAGTQSTLAVQYSNGHYQTVTTGNPLSISFTGWPATSYGYGWVTLGINVANVAHTVTLPSSVTINKTGIQGLNPSTNIITFAAAGFYEFTFSTIDNGTNIAINQTNSQLTPFNNSAQSLLSGGNVSLATTTTYFGGTGTATLAAGTAGQIKVLAQAAAGNIVVTATNPGWTTNPTGTITLSDIGEAVTLQVINGDWFCIGNNGATFA